MSSTHNPGKVAGFWHLLLIVIGPLRGWERTATVNNIAAHQAAHQWLFRLGIVGDLVCGVTNTG